MSVATSSMQTVDSAIRSLFSSFTEAWDKHDAKALASLFTEDGDLINPEGRVANGRREIERLLQDEQSNHLKNSRMKITINQARPLTSDLAVVTDDCEITGVQDPSGGGPRTMHAITTFVLQNQRGAWRIVSARPMIPAVRPK